LRIAISIKSELCFFSLLFPIGLFFFNGIYFEGLDVEAEAGRLWKGYQIFGMDKKNQSKNKNAFFPTLKFDTLS
jgi:hypothetical protein